MPACVSRAAGMKGPDDDGAWHARRRRVFLLRRANFKSVYPCRVYCARDKRATKHGQYDVAAAAAADKFDVNQNVVFSVTQRIQHHNSNRETPLRRVCAIP